MSKTKILLFDIETSPNLGYIWGKYEQDVVAFEQEWYMLSFAYKWLGEKKTYAYGLPNFSLYKTNKTSDLELVKKLHELMDEADIVIGHNSDNFDIRKANARFIANGLTPPSPFKSVDTKKVAKRYFQFNTNKLDDLGKYLKVGQKLSTGGFDLWLGCMSGHKQSWKKMIEYNKQDVVLLEKVYETLLPWISNHPNINVMDDNNRCCTNCGSDKIQKRGFGFNSVTKYQRYVCTSCGKWSKSKPIRTMIEVR